LLGEWKGYCRRFDVSVWGASPEDLISYLQGVYSRCHSVSTVYQHLSSVSYFYRLKGLESPSNNPLVAMYMKGLKREKLTVSAPVKRAKPMTSEILGRLIDYLLAAPR
jgi:hypothetical protein